MAQKREILSFYDFTGGLNDTLTPDRMSPKELEQADNIDLSIRGGFGYRNGTINTNEVSFNDDVMYIMEFPIKDGSIMELSVMKNKKLYETTGGKKREIAQLANYDIDHVIYRNAIYLVDGDNYYSYGLMDYNTQLDSTNIKKDEIVYNNPISTGSNPGVFKHYYKAKADISSLDLKTADYGDTTKWEDVTHTKFDIPDVLKEVVPKTGESDNDLKPIKKCRVIQVHPKSHRIFVGGNPEDESCLYYSESGSPNHFKVTNKLYPTGGEGVIKSINAIYQSIIVGYTHGWWEYSGIDEQDWKWMKLPIPYGAVNKNVIELTPMSFMFFSKSGIIRVSIGTLDSNVVVYSEDTLVTNITDGRVEKIINSIKNHKHTVSTFSDGKYLLAYSEEDSETNDKVLVFDSRQNNFARYTDLKINHMIQKLDGDIYFGSKNYIMKFDKDIFNDTDENGELKPIKFNIKTIRFNFGLPFNTKLFHRFFISSNQGVDIGNQFKMLLKIDYSIGNETVLDLNNESMIWGISEWGKVWGLADIASMELGLRKKGVRIQVILNGEMINTMNSVVVYGVGFDVEYLRAKAKNMGTKKLLDEDYNMID